MGKKDAPLTKISSPVIGKSRVLPSKRLFRLLDKGLKKPFLWIAGPPGSGKTTLIASYLTHLKLPHLWYQMDTGDTDLATFFYWLGMAAGSKRKSFPALTPEYQDLSAFARRYFEKFYGAIRKAPFVIVFDNEQEIPADSQFHRTIYEGLIKIPEGIHIVFISHSELHPVFARLQTYNVMEVIGWESLRLTIEETAKIVRHDWERPSKEDIEYLQSKTGGWVAGLKFLLEKGKTEGRMSPIATPLDSRTIFDYFGEEIFRNMDDDAREMLLKTSFLPQVSVEVAKRLTGIEGAGQILEDLNRRNYFTSKYASPRISYRYHPLFREYLLSTAESRFSQDEIAQLCQAAAELLQASGQEEAAADLFLKGGAYDKAAALICRYAPGMFFQGRHMTVREKLSMLPAAIIERNPFLLHIYGECLMPFDPGESRNRLERAFTLFRDLGDAGGMLMTASATVETYLHEWDRLDALDNWIDILIRLVAELPSFPSPFVEARVTTAIFQALLYRKPDHNELPEWRRRMEALLEQDIGSNQRLMTGYMLMLYYSFTGNYRKMSALRHAQQPLLGAPDVSPIIRVTSFCLHAVCEWLTAPTENVYRLVAQGKAMADKLGIHLLDGKLFAQGACAAFSIGDIQRAGQYIDGMAACTGQRRLEVAQYQHMKSLECFLRGDPAASAHAEQALALTLEAGSPIHEGLCRLRMAQILLKAGDCDNAEEHLDRAHEISSATGSRNIKFCCLLYKALLADTRGDASLCEDYVRSAMAIGRQQWYLNYDGWDASVMSALCVKAIEAGIETDYVEDLIRKRDLVPESPPFHLENWPWALKITTLGPFGLTRDGKPVIFQGKVQKKPLEMLGALIAYKGRDVSEEKIVDALWPEALGDASRSSFSTTLQRLRKLIGNEEALILGDGRLSISSRHCWVDIWSFERILSEGEEALRGGDRENAAGLFEKAISLYHGDFLTGGSTYSWAISARERLRTKFIRAVGRLGEHWENQGVFDRAAGYYQKGLEIDSLAEEFYQRLMICYRSQGRRAEALAVYRRCRDTLQAVLGVEPSPKTEAMFMELKQK